VFPLLPPSPRPQLRRPARRCSCATAADNPPSTSRRWCGLLPERRARSASRVPRAVRWENAHTDAVRLEAGWTKAGTYIHSNPRHIQLTGGTLCWPLCPFNHGTFWAHSCRQLRIDPPVEGSFTATLLSCYDGAKAEMRWINRQARKMIDKNAIKTGISQY
jgi:hypothetical protein